jgi:fumarate hydratase subunit beta
MQGSLVSQAEIIELDMPLSEEDVCRLRAGDVVRLSGALYTARDAAHQRMFALIRAGRPLPFELEGQVIYYCGPTPPPPGRPIGAAGPTTSYRMDEFAPELYRLGLRGSIGKGNRSARVRQALRRFRGVYFVAVGGAGAFLGDRVVSAEIIAWPELGPEAVRRLVVEQFPVIVGYDCVGGTAFVGEKPLS